jgi:hypothetical protein
MNTQTIVRIVIPLLSSIGAFFGAIYGFAKVFPERAQIITGYQLKVIESLQKQNDDQAGRITKLEGERRTQAHSIGNLEQEITALRSELRNVKAS